MRSVVLSISMLVLGAATHSACARENKGGYVAAGIGQSEFSASVDDIKNAYPYANIPDDITFSTDGLDFTLFGGFRFSRYLAVEGGYEYFGRYEYHVGTSKGSLLGCDPPPGGCTYADDPPEDFSIGVHGLKVQARGSIPITSWLTADAAVGLALVYAQSPDKHVDGLETLEFIDMFGPLYTVGISGKVADRWWLRLDYSNLQSQSEPPYGAGEVTTIRLSIERRFFGD